VELFKYLFSGKLDYPTRNTGPFKRPKFIKQTKKQANLMYLMLWNMFSKVRLKFGALLCYKKKNCMSAVHCTDYAMCNIKYSPPISNYAWLLG
jgi:hypothetical protein